MTFSERSDLMDMVHKLQHRVSLLNLVADGMCRPDASNENANALGVLAGDMSLDLSTLVDGLDAIEVTA